MRRDCLFLSALLLLLCLCTASAEARVCRVVVEDSDLFTCAQPVKETAPGGTVTFALTPVPGVTLTGTDHAGDTLTPDGAAVTLTVTARYSAVITVSGVTGSRSITYEPNGADAEPVTLAVSDSHIRPNTAGLIFDKPGCTLLGWSASPEDGDIVTPGARIDMAGDTLTLYARWAKWSDAALFTFERHGDGAAVTGYTGGEETVVIPGEWNGLPVTTIASGALAGTACGTVVLPPTVTAVEENAFADSAVTTLWMPDSVTQIHDNAFTGCAVRTLRIIAVRDPVYSGSYYSTFADKMDWLASLRGQKKLILFSGSSTRFGYNSAALDAALPGWTVANMGVFAYTNAWPQLLLILREAEAGDILLHSP